MNHFAKDAFMFTFYFKNQQFKWELSLTNVKLERWNKTRPRNHGWKCERRWECHTVFTLRVMSQSRRSFLNQKDTNALSPETVYVLQMQLDHWTTTVNGHSSSAKVRRRLCDHAEFSRHSQSHRTQLNAVHVHVSAGPCRSKMMATESLHWDLDHSEAAMSEARIKRPSLPSNQGTSN